MTPSTLAIPMAVFFSNHCASHSLHHPGKGMYLLAFLLPPIYNFGTNAQPSVSVVLNTRRPVGIAPRCVVAPTWLTQVSQNQSLAASTGTMSHKLTILLISGTKPKPGPRRPRFPHPICTKVNQKALACDACSHWTHGSWANMRTNQETVMNKGLLLTPTDSKECNAMHAQHQLTEHKEERWRPRGPH